MMPLVMSVAVTALAFGSGAISWEDFEPREFEGRTRYAKMPDGLLSATSDGTASGLFREAPVDLERTPVLCWQWRAGTLPRVSDHREKAGDDFAARVYVVHRRGLMGMSTLSVNYVWTSLPPPQAHWPNPFTDRVRMVPVESGAGGWAHETRNVREDFRRLFDVDVKELDAVAIMTDSDNSDSVAAAVYAPLRFAATAEACDSTVAN